MDQNRYRVCVFSLDEDLFNSFKKLLFREKVSAAKLIEQFLVCYAYCLDSSFLNSANEIKRKRGRKPYHFRVLAENYNAFAEKAGKELMDTNSLIEQFLKNYSTFIKTVRSPHKQESRVKC